MRTIWGSATDRGRVRRLNEDSLLAYPPVFVVADGMGGHSAGDVASRIAVEEFAGLAGRMTVTADDVHECVGRISQRIRGSVGERSAGTTVAGVADASTVDGSYWLVFNIGDSRVYRWASGALEQISVDHSVVQELVDRGELALADAPSHPDRHVITRALGTDIEPEPDYWLLPAGSADRILVCSDGLTSELSDDDLGEILSSVSDPQNAAIALVDLAVRRGGRDNVSAVVVDIATGGRPDDVERTADTLARAAAATSHDGLGAVEDTHESVAHAVRGTVLRPMPDGQEEDR